jgi:hypothetical protein
MKPAGNLLFASVDVLPILDKKTAADAILALDTTKSFWDDYRYTRMFPLMTKSAQLGRDGTSNNRDGEFEWTELAPKVIVDWCEDHVFPWLGMRTRVMALITQPGVANYEHIDCNIEELHTQQHKLRIVLQGKTSTLYWLTDQGKVYAPEVEGAFVMDGGWPHGMVNTTDEVKVTIAFGSPWLGKDDYGSDITLLQDRDNFLMPKSIGHLWEKR